MTTKTIFQVFDNYQKARLCFAQALAEISIRPQNAEILENAGAIELLKALMNDPSPQIQQCAAIAMGRIIQNNALASSKLLDSNFLPMLLSGIGSKAKHQKKAALFVLRALCKHDAEMATFVANNGGLATLVACLEDFESYVKEAAAWGIGYIARHNAKLSKTCVDAGALPLLILCLQEPDLTVKQVAVSALADIAKHNLELAQAVVDMGAVPHLVRNLSNTDEKLKRQILCALGSCAKHSAELAEVIVEAEIFPSVLMHLTHPSTIVRRNAACLIREIVKHSLELTQLVVNTGGVGALTEVVSYSDDDVKIPCITTLGYMAGHSEQLALSVLGCNFLVALTDIINGSTNDTLLAVATWTLGQVGKHSPETAQAVAASDVYVRLNEILVDQKSSEDLKCKIRNTLKLCLQKCMLLSALEPLLFNSDPSILKYVLGQYSKVLPEDPTARRVFVTSGALKRVQEIEVKPGTTLMEYINTINACFPEEIVHFYSPGYSDSLLEKVEQYSPQLMTVLRESQHENVDIQTDLTAVLDDTSECDQNLDAIDCHT